MKNDLPWYPILAKLTEADQIVAFVADLLRDRVKVLTPRLEALERELFETRVDLLRAREEARAAMAEESRGPTEAQAMQAAWMLAVEEVRRARRAEAHKSE